MWEKMLDFIIELGTTAGLKLLYALAILIIGFKLSKWIINRISVSRAFKHMENSILKFMCNILKVALNATIIIAAAITIGIPATSFITILGSAGLAIGLALQGSLSNFAGSIMIMLFKPFKIGDYVKTGDIEGTVADINIFYTIMDTVDNKRISCPNGSLSNSNIINYTSQDMRRVDLVFSVSYDSDIEKIKKVMMNTVLSTENVLSNPEPIARLTGHSQSSLDFVLRAWCKTDDYWNVYFDLMEGIKDAFNKNGIEIPYNQMDIHIKNEK